MPEIVRNVVKLIVIRKKRVKCRRGQTWSGFAKPVAVVYFGLLLDKLTVWVAESENRVAAIFLLPVWPIEPPGRSFFPLFWRVLSRYRTSTARKAFYKKTGCTKSKSVVRKYSWETGSTFQSARNCPKCREIDRISKNACKKSSWSNLKWTCKTGSSFVLWPTFREIDSLGRWVRKTGRRHISTSGLASRAPGGSFFALFWPVLSPYRT